MMLGPFESEEAAHATLVEVEKDAREILNGMGYDLRNHQPDNPIRGRNPLARN